MKAPPNHHKTLNSLSVQVSVPSVVQFVQLKIYSNAMRKLAFATMLLIPLSVGAQEPAEQFFETEVRPLLIAKCSMCHGEKKISGGLRVNSLKSLIDGGDSGSAIIPGNPSESLLIQAVQRTGEMPMPPDEELSAGEVGVLRKWVEMGAPWPESGRSNLDTSAAAKNHWAFQRISRPNIPEVTNQDWIRTPIDSFVLAELEHRDLSVSPSADRRDLIRRVNYSLTGLPPTPADVDRFVADTDVNAYEHLVQRLLESPQYGEHWGRHWLDVARYSDTKGYVYAREERHWVHAWTYRDWVAKSLNDDMPYDRFLLLQLAADQVERSQRGRSGGDGILDPRSSVPGCQAGHH